MAKAAIDAAQLEVQAAGLVEPDVTETRTETRTDTEGDAFRELRSKVDFGRYIQGALTGGGITHGAELELNQHLGIAENLFPLELLAGPLETRAKRDGDAEASQGTWLDRVMHGTAADRVGISFRSVSPGVAAFPVTTAAGGSSVQRGREEAVSESHLHRGRHRDQARTSCRSRHLQHRRQCTATRPCGRDTAGHERGHVGDG